MASVLRLRPFLRWLPPTLLVIVALIAWQTAGRADFDRVTPVPESYDASLGTPMLSARRVPRTLRAPISDDLIAPQIETVSAGSPGQACVVVRNGDRILGQPTDIPGGLIPASNQKVLTSYAALGILGADFAFTTRAVALGAPQDGVLDGDLILIGDGDPFLITENWLTQFEDVDGRFHTRLEDLADEVVAAGITSITGSVVGDESLLDTERTGPWDQRLIDQKQSGPLSAMTVNEGFTQWPETFPGASRNRSETDNPPVHSAAVFAELLAERGVTVAGPAGSAVAPANVVELGAVDSPPLRDLLTHVNSFSSNIGAELILKRLGLETTGQGTTAAGASAVTNYLIDQGIPMTDVQIFDGSGLAETNRVTCDALASILTSGSPDDELGQSLSIGGNRGSLANRFVDSPADGRVMAKTGTLRQVLALTGYVASGVAGNDDEFVSFAYIVNDDVIETDQILAIQDTFMASLAQYPSGPAIEELSPLPITPN